MSLKEWVLTLSCPLFLLLPCFASSHIWHKKQKVFRRCQFLNPYLPSLNLWMRNFCFLYLMPWYLRWRLKMDWGTKAHNYILIRWLQWWGLSVSGREMTSTVIVAIPKVSHNTNPISEVIWFLKCEQFQIRQGSWGLCCRLAVTFQERTGQPRMNVTAADDQEKHRSPALTDQRSSTSLGHVALVFQFSQPVTSLVGLTISILGLHSRQSRIISRIHSSPFLSPRDGGRVLSYTKGSGRESVVPK